MGSNVLDGRPTPVSRIGQWADFRLVVVCQGCKRRVVLPIGELTRQHRIPPDTRMYRLEERLRCACGGQGRIAGVDGWRGIR